jgi:hypothetical protein
MPFLLLRKLNVKSASEPAYGPVFKNRSQELRIIEEIVATDAILAWKPEMWLRRVDSNSSAANGSFAGMGELGN